MRTGPRAVSSQTIRALPVCARAIPARIDAIACPCHRLLHARLVKRLQQIVHTIHVKRADGVLVISRRKDNLRHRLGAPAPQAIVLHHLLDDCKPIQAGHLHIQKYQIRPVLLNQVDTLDSVRPLCNHVNAPHRIQKELKLLASQLFVVDDERGEVHAGLTQVAVEVRL